MKVPEAFTILRFAHAFASGGGVETYLEDLDRELLRRNPWTIIRFYLTGRKDEREPVREEAGRGILIRVPLYAERKVIPGANDPRERVARWKGPSEDFVRDYIIYHPLLYRLFFRKLIRKRPIPAREIEAFGARAAVSAIMRDHRIDLLAMHYVGGLDSAEIIAEAVERNVPYVAINHFSNDRLNHLSFREQSRKASGIGGVTNVGIPRWLHGRFFNLFDGIDTNVFKTESARPVPVQDDVPIALLPARITPAKGQKDLIQICASLHKEGIEVKAALAGRADSPEYIQMLKNLARESGIEKDVLFLGELSPMQVRDWYAAAKVLAFPTYHHEGLPRVLLEAQAVKLPPISYISGGTPGAITHGKTGYLVAKGDIPGFTAKLRELITNERKRVEMGHAGRATVMENFSLPALASRHEAFYLKYS